MISPHRTRFLYVTHLYISIYTDTHTQTKHIVVILVQATNLRGIIIRI